MNQLYFNIFILRKRFITAFIMTLAFFSCIFFNGLTAIAADDYNVTGHYYLPNLKTPGKYKDVIQWKVTNIDEWNRFVNKLQKLPKGEEVDNPLSLGQTSMVHFTQINPDKISGNEIYLSKAGIQQYARMPTDEYHYKNEAMRKFLEAELKKRPGYGADSQKKLNLSAPGIVVTYRGSSILENPNWRITDQKEFELYKSYIDKLVPLPEGQTLRMELKKTVYDDVGTFLLYLNYPGAKFQILAVTPESGVRGTTVNLRRFFFKDSENYYPVFKKQAEDIIRGNDARRNGINLNDSSSRF